MKKKWKWRADEFSVGDSTRMHPWIRSWWQHTAATTTLPCCSSFIHFRSTGGSLHFSLHRMTTVAAFLGKIFIYLFRNRNTIYYVHLKRIENWVSMCALSLSFSVSLFLSWWVAYALIPSIPFRYICIAQQLVDASRFSLMLLLHNTTRWLRFHNCIDL